MRTPYAIVTTTSSDGEVVHHAVRDAHRSGLIRRRLEDKVPIGEVLEAISCDFFELGHAEQYVAGKSGEVTERLSFDVAHPGLPGPDEARALAWASRP